MGYLGDKYSKKILLSGLYFLRGVTLILLFFYQPLTCQQYCSELHLGYYG